MSQQTEGNIKSFVSAEALAVYRIVKLASGSGVNVQYADEADGVNGIGVTQKGVAISTDVAVALKFGGRTFMVTADGAITAGDEIFPSDDGKVSNVATDKSRIGRALETATADGDIIEAILFDSYVEYDGIPSSGLA